MDPESIITKDIGWRDRHVTQNQYMLQILKCNNSQCCKPRRSSIFKILGEGGLPFPLSLIQTENGLQVGSLSEIESYAPLFVTLSIAKNGLNAILPISLKKYIQIPYDVFCPSVQSKLDNRICTCGKYFSSISSMKDHSSKFCKKKKVKLTKPLKILGERENEKLVVIEYDDDVDVEWAYDIDLDLSDLELVDVPQQSLSQICEIDVAMNPLWEFH